MTFCFNPDCLQPKNESQAAVCAACNTPLILRDRYQATGIIGQGGFGRTILAHDIQLPGNPVCVIKQLKIASPDPRVIAKSKELFQREAETLGKTGNHPHLPRLLDFFAADQQFYLVQEYVEGPTLQQEISHSGKFTEAKVWALLHDLLPTLDYLHNQQVIHRDIKPTNIIRRTLDNKLILIDFGAVKEKVNQAIGADLAMEPAPATVVGTPGFSPPEQMARRPVFASDIYSLGITCLYLLTGKAPDRFDYDQQTGELSWQSQVTLSDPLQQILEMMLKVSVRDRYPSAQAALADIEIQEQRLKAPSSPSSISPASAQPTAKPDPNPGTGKPSSPPTDSGYQLAKAQSRPDFIQKSQQSRQKTTMVSLPSLSELANLAPPPKSRAWWNRPLCGNYSLRERLLFLFRKQSVSERALQLHQQAMWKITDLVKAALAIDNDRFGNQEFLAYIRLQYILGHGGEDYESLNRSIELLRVGIKAKNSYLKIEQTEVAFRGKQQQEFYQYVETLLATDVLPESFQDQCQGKMEALLPTLKSEEGKRALTTYMEHLTFLADHELGLYLLSLFKQYQLSNYSALDTVGKIVDSLKMNELYDIKALVSQVIAEQQVFDQLGEMIGVPKHKNAPETYAQMLQYISLSEKYKEAYPRFQELMRLLEQWYQQYHSIFAIRQEYNSCEYKRPKAFAQLIPGIDLYSKYETYFTGAKT